MDRKDFINQLRRYQKGSISRRHFMGATGLGTATAVLATSMPALLSGCSKEEKLGGQVNLTTWPDYHEPKNFEKFAEKTGAKVNVTVFGSNEEMFAKLKAGGTGWDVLVPTNYTIESYVKEDLIEALDTSLVPNFDPSTYTDKRFTEAGTIGDKVYAIHKDWGTTGYVLNKAKIPDGPTTWKEFWDLARSEKYSGRTMVHDYQLTTIGNALKYYGYSFNSNDEKELAEAEKLLLDAKPHLFGINSDYKPALLNGDAWMSICWTGDAKQLRKTSADFDYIIGKEGGEIWADFYTVCNGAPNRAAAYALINFLIDPEVNKDEVLFHGYPVADSRVIKLLPADIVNDPIMYPAAELLTPLEFGAAATLTNPARAEIMARFKSA